MQSCILSIANIFVQGYVNSYGDVVISGIAAADTFAGYIQSITGALYLASPVSWLLTAATAAIAFVIAYGGLSRKDDGEELVRIA